MWSRFKIKNKASLDTNSRLELMCYNVFSFLVEKRKHFAFVMIKWINIISKITEYKSFSGKEAQINLYGMFLDLYDLLKKKKKKALNTKGTIYKVPEKKPCSNGPCELLSSCNFTLGLALKI